MTKDKNKKSLPSQKGAGKEEEYSESVLNIRRVAKVIKGGRRFAFSVLVVVGDRKGKVGVALGKSREVASAISKALRRARKNMITIPLYKTTIPYTVQAKHSSSVVLIRSASKGTGIIAGGAVRSVMEAIGVRDVLAKSLKSPNPQNVVKATLKALQKLYKADQLLAMRGRQLKDIFGENNVTA